MSKNPLQKKKKKGHAPAHQNKTAFKHNKNSKTTKKILAMPNQGLCARCTELIEWKKRYRKYKPRTVPGKCVECHERNIQRAYHMVCDGCVRKLNCCAKCRAANGDVVPIETAAERQARELEEAERLAFMSERERRTYLRQQRRLASADSDEEGDETTERAAPAPTGATVVIVDKSDDDEDDFDDDDDDDNNDDNDKESFEEEEEEVDDNDADANNEDENEGGKDGDDSSDEFAMDNPF